MKKNPAKPVPPKTKWGKYKKTTYPATVFRAGQITTRAFENFGNAARFAWPDGLVFEKKVFENGFTRVRLL